MSDRKPEFGKMQDFSNNEDATIEDVMENVRELLTHKAYMGCFMFVMVDNDDYGGVHFLQHSMSDGWVMNIMEDHLKQLRGEKDEIN